MARWHSCNVLLPGEQIRQIWQFNSAAKFNLLRTESKLPSEPLPEKLVAKDWSTLFQPRLNIAWLPAGHVFLRVIQLPKADLAETRSMVELQLEKLSPLPVTQIVWSFEVMPFVAQGGATDHLNPHATGELQTVVVITALRSRVEEFLGQLETQGYLADRLELPVLDQLRATQVRGDGAWVFPATDGQEGTCLVAWWYDGVLQNLGLLNLPAEARRADAFREQLAQTTWAGELEGWLTCEPRYHLVADADTAARWLPLFDAAQAPEVVAPVGPQELAALTARRASAEGSTTNLLPPEFAVRYRSRFVDRLWMRGLGAVLLVYIVCAMLYMGLVTWATMRHDSMVEETRGYSQQYTNTLQVREKLRVLQDTLDLQYAALECYKAAADFLPPELTLEYMDFSGRKVSFRGTGGGEDRGKVSEFNAALQKAEIRGQPLFSNVSFGNVTTKPGGQIDWSISCDLRRTDE
ncbi:MAG: hypothetical protein RJA22_1398 [Verrucomicrobiota bacterium]|jgi:hypothetical protein